MPAPNLSSQVAVVGAVVGIRAFESLGREHTIQAVRNAHMYMSMTLTYLIQHAIYMYINIPIYIYIYIHMHTHSFVYTHTLSHRRI